MAFKVGDRVRHVGSKNAEWEIVGITGQSHDLRLVKQDPEYKDQITGRPPPIGASGWCGTESDLTLVPGFAVGDIVTHCKFPYATFRVDVLDYRHGTMRVVCMSTTDKRLFVVGSGAWDTYNMFTKVSRTADAAKAERVEAKTSAFKNAYGYIKSGPGLKEIAEPATKAPVSATPAISLREIVGLVVEGWVETRRDMDGQYSRCRRCRAEGRGKVALVHSADCKVGHATRR